MGFAAQALLVGFEILYDLLLGFGVWQPTSPNVWVYQSTSLLFVMIVASHSRSARFRVFLYQSKSCSLGFRALPPAILFSGLQFTTVCPLKVFKVWPVDFLCLGIASHPRFVRFQGFPNVIVVNLVPWG